MTFCAGDGCTRFNRCHRALTPKVLNEADRWWGISNPPSTIRGEAPIAKFTQPRTLKCFSLSETEEYFKSSKEFLTEVYELDESLYRHNGKQ